MNTSKNDREIWLCLNFTRLPVEVFNRQQSETPVVVLHRQRVICMNTVAEALGIRLASSMNTAYTISEQIVSVERDEKKEFATLEHLAQWAYQFTPSVVVKAPQCLLLEISGCLKLFRGLDNLKQNIREALDKLGFTATLGINGTPLAAQCFAQTRRADNLDDVANSLAPVAIHHLQIEPRILESLQQMGIADCRQLLALPLDGLNRRFGIFFTDYLQRLTGQKPDPQKFITSKPRFGSEINFLSDVTSLESLVFPVKRLLGELHDFLRGRQLQVSQFSFRLAHRSHAAKTFNVMLANPDNDPAMFLMLTQLKLDQIDDMPEVDSLTLTARHFHDMEAPSGDLFHGTRFQQKDGSRHSKAEAAKALELINMMTARLGPQACFGLALANDHRPEQAWRPIALNARREAVVFEETSARPLYLLAQPPMLESPGDLPHIAGPLTLLQGPERIDFGWWDDGEVSRDYFVARHACGALYWVYRQLSNNQWYLHGIFS